MIKIGDEIPNYKIGDEVEDPTFGKGVIVDIKLEHNYPIKVKFYYLPEAPFTLKGTFYECEDAGRLKVTKRII